MHCRVIAGSSQAFFDKQDKGRTGTTPTRSEPAVDGIVEHGAAVLNQPPPSNRFSFPKSR
ncbi:hypothetical protein [Nevskia ramosa]|uniref:hypothetical protein n=1 Tax=Nevskia ramosa TaxID=64002 RepID=UPI00146C36AD|nr:hypothetical protein [Nevskia ramosa]